MTVRNISQTKAELSALLVKVEKGEEVIISRAGRPIAKIISVDRPLEKRKLGGLKGKIWISPDFDAPDPEIERLFNGE